MEELIGAAGTHDTFATMKEIALASGVGPDAVRRAVRGRARVRWIPVPDSDRPPAEPGVEVELKYRLLDLAAGERFLAAETLGPFRAVSAARAAQHEDRYLDTSDGALARAGHAARLRQARGGTVVTVKSTTAPDGALARREELEGPADRAAEPRDWPPSAARSLILELCGDAPLVELVTVRQLRRKRRLKATDATVELSLDEVDVVARGRVIHRFAELEAELTVGCRGASGRVATDPRGRCDPHPGDGVEARRGPRRDHADDGSPAAEASAAGAGAEAAAADAVRAIEAERTAIAKAEKADRRAHPRPTMPPVGERRAARGDRRAARAAAAETAPAAESPSAETPAPAPARKSGRKKAAKDAADGSAAVATEPAPRHGEGLVVGKTPGVLASDNVAEAGRKVLRFHLARMIAREPGTREGTDPEELHADARRHAADACRVAGLRRRLPAGPDAPAPQAPARGRRDGSGAVRDLDVLIEEAEPYLAAPDGHRAARDPPLFAGLAPAARRRAGPSRARARQRRLRALGGRVQGLRADRGPGRGIDPADGAAPHPRDRRVAHLGGLRAGPGVRAGHALGRRRDAPRAPDHLEVAALHARVRPGVPRARMWRTLIARVVALQDHLGLMHDADVAASMVRAFLVDGAGRLSEVETAAIGRYLVRSREGGRPAPPHDRAGLAGDRRRVVPAGPREVAGGPLGGVAVVDLVAASWTLTRDRYTPVRRTTQIAWHWRIAMPRDDRPHRRRRAMSRSIETSAASRRWSACSAKRRRASRP